MPEANEASYVLEPAGLARLSHISIETRGLDRAFAFYRDTFGMQPIWDREQSGEKFEQIISTPGARSRFIRGIIGGTAVLQLWEHNWREPRETHTTLMSFEVRDAQAAYSGLSAAGVATVSEPVEFDDCWAFVILDPDNHSIEIIQWKGAATPYRLPSLPGEPGPVS